MHLISLELRHHVEQPMWGRQEGVLVHFFVVGEGGGGRRRDPLIGAKWVPHGTLDYSAKRCCYSTVVLPEINLAIIL